MANKKDAVVGLVVGMVISLLVEALLLPFIIQRLIASKNAVNDGNWTVNVDQTVGIVGVTLLVTFIGFLIAILVTSFKQ